ncbi:uncharacterized protein RAG0_10292 [Rhynchosporium agropyri]|uniref:Uncharacterized protein n=1 Tax=Rhynchosporium agropyri TaxID=914238 RepID=A0A1E1KZ96_9HELO|nr:uncharacterized protein RAG0_10292 [Rhynchosporium agropyri]
MYSSRHTSHMPVDTFDDAITKHTSKRSYRLRVTFILFTVWLASSAAFGSLIAVWQTSDCDISYSYRAASTQGKHWWSELVARDNPSS